MPGIVLGSGDQVTNRIDTVFALKDLTLRGVGGGLS